jgi:hypothetical protein
MAKLAKEQLQDIVLTETHYHHDLSLQHHLSRVSLFVFI